MTSCLQRITQLSFAEILQASWVYQACGAADRRITRCVARGAVHREKKGKNTKRVHSRPLDMTSSQHTFVSSWPYGAVRLRLRGRAGGRPPARHTTRTLAVRQLLVNSVVCISS